MQQRALEDAQILQRLKRLERVGVELSAIEDAREARPFEKIVGQDFVPEIDDFLGLGEEAMAADVEQKALVVRGAADAADIGRVLLEYEDVAAVFGQGVGGGQASGACADDERFDECRSCPPWIAAAREFPHDLLNTKPLALLRL